ncbi:MAG: ParA family protein [Lachnospiraceae bacterium]|jgi:cellulose biosynthesis protein BcsQ|nr:ParA family protein [Lachnospiraceae bacterium]
MATYNLVNSVKGGCGKTTFSIWMAYYLEAALLIDMDLLGTSMQIIFHGNTDTCQGAFTNDVFKGVKNSKKRFVEKVELEDGGHINVIFSSMDYLEKEKFKSGRYSGYTPAVKHNIFRLGLRELIKYNKSIDGELVEHFIFDMPPNSDGFSDAAMECIFNPKYSDLEEKDRKNLFIVIGTDWGQTFATINELKALLVHSDEKEPDRIFLVLNHNLGSNFGNEGYTARKNKIQVVLNGLGLSEKIRKKIFFLKMEHNEYYTDLGIGGEEAGKGLKNAEADEINNAFPKAVVSAIAEYGKDFEDVLMVDTEGGKEDGKEKLLNLILGQ